MQIVFLTFDDSLTGKMMIKKKKKIIPHQSWSFLLQSENLHIITNHSHHY